MKKVKQVLASTLLASTLTQPVLAQSQVTVDIYNPQNKSIFAVSSSIISGDSEVLLVDAQFQRNDAQALVEKIKASGKKLTTIFISHSDPDFYFGLDVLKTAFPNAKILATKSTVDNIKHSMQGKLNYWGPILKANAPTQLFVPEVTLSNSLTIDGTDIFIKNLQHDPKHTYLWIPSIKTVVGGVVVFDKMHAWLADSSTVAERKTWQVTLTNIEGLAPEVVIPGHFLAGSKQDLSAVSFMKDYLNKADGAAKSAKNSAEFVEIMTQAYPDLGAKSILDLSSKVVMGEMQWH
ncbi:MULTISPECIES: MBL fold metallo-hydrolase [Pseudoalteromonas]|uniref:MBL fold metallo-hydrolase n=1 Tax=Pseudoalteromonas haloplanktis TaxID=228 RepID=A0ABU1B7Z1_PSEHA|nr:MULTISPECIES: MBL fold metallo-hydrolase [Pseudoalteromonas]MCF6146495.1 hypothetical protein [Pseudoalteromonas mariniglutinosa NCIMB 1770]MDQ9090446.1 MBL fold metallo-hydrolase [Pseudoalteromonas haloplanktis]TMN72470.1 MBL fold metallo-hydrolase [Pseudoalteromonas sp. S1727]